MGYIETTLEKVTNLVDTGLVKSVCDLGAQNNYTVPYLPAPYMSEWYKNKDVEYMSIDLNGENDSKPWNLCEPVKTTKVFDLVVNAGTAEHCKDLFQVFTNIHKLTKVGGLMLHENPRTGNWPGHGNHYFTNDFYEQLAAAAGYEILDLKNTVAMHNYKTGNNVFCLLKKVKKEFITKDQFPTAHAL
jgi:hypothetical protein